MTNNEDLPKILICYVEEVAYDAKKLLMIYSREFMTKIREASTLDEQAR